MRQKYYGVRKVDYDKLWHGLYEINGRETWDRISTAEAMKWLEQTAAKMKAKSDK